MNPYIKISRPDMSRELHERLLSILLAHQDVRETCDLTQRAIDYHRAALEKLNVSQPQPLPCDSSAETPVSMEDDRL